VDTVVKDTVVEDGVKVELRSHWIPTRASSEQMLIMELEFSLNHVPKDALLSMAEMVLATGDVEAALSSVPPVVPPEIRSRMSALLQPWPEGRYTEAYKRSGGILNLFTPAWGEAQDEVWAGMVAGWQAATYPGEEARQAALRELEQRWNRTPHPFFAGLTPEQVMVGGGPQEKALAREFLEHLSELFDGQGFESEGKALIKTVLLLRGWQCEPHGRGGSRRKVIVAERDELLTRRARLMEDLAGSPDGRIR
jgi:hypothetical protein